MVPLRILTVTALLLALVASARAQDKTPELLTAHGTVATVEKDSLTIRPREASGRFGKHLVLKLTGTSKISLLTSRMQGGKLVIVQRDTDAKDLQPKQEIAVIYTTGAAGATLLSAVVQSPPAK